MRSLFSPEYNYDSIVFKQDLTEKKEFLSDKVKITYVSDPSLLEYKRYPVSLGTGLATIGGLFATMKIFLLFVHEFNRK